MIKFDTEKMGDGSGLKIAGSPEDLAIEVASLAKTIYDVIKDYDEDMARMYEMNLLCGVTCAFESDEKEKKRVIEEHTKQMEMINKLKGIKEFLDKVKEGLEKERGNLEKDNITDIRRSEFDSDEEFKKWFHSVDTDDDK